MICIIILQVFLSKRYNKWLGLILPIISVLFSIRLVLDMTFNGEESTREIIMQTVLVFLSWNILTGCLMDIYFTCREKLEKKMNIQD
ncbi:hypothetical protein [Clostridium sp.]|uniref:hypothetical protein n=1 Tax=Clostridium sp. TaxID=1506 RepID=UPI003D6DA24E